VSGATVRLVSRLNLAPAGRRVAAGQQAGDRGTMRVCGTLFGSRIDAGYRWGA